MERKFNFLKITKGREEGKELSYSPELSDNFVKDLEKYSKKDKNLKLAAYSIIEHLEVDPYGNSKRLASPFKGKRSIHVSKTKFRIIFSICEECRKLKEEHLNQCYECEKKEDNTIIIRMIDKRKRIYKRKRK